MLMDCIDGPIIASIVGPVSLASSLRLLCSRCRANSVSHLPMDSLLATYASSDDEDVDLPRHQPPPSSAPSSASFFTSLPPPRSSSSLFAAIPPPKSQHHQNPRNSSPAATSDSVSPSATLFNSPPRPRSRESETLEFQTPSSLISSLPAPEFGDSNLKANLNLSAPTEKKVVLFKPPISTFVSGERNSDSEDDEDEEEKERKRRREVQSMTEAPTVKSFLSSIPAPKNSKAALGALPTSGSGRRSIIEADVPSLKQQQKQHMEEASAAVDDSTAAVDNYHQGGFVDGYASNAAGVDSSSWYQSGESYGDYGGASYAGGYGQYDSNWIDRSDSNSIQEATYVPEIMSRELGKRRKNDVPAEIIEVKQDELMKNRPREDQVKATGIAFGPSYQPVSSAKGKPSKLHKRKHQIGSLYFDMKQKETELAERRSRGFLTKAETHAKYGW